MAGIVYLKTDRFEVKLEGITFKLSEFEPLCTMGLLFPKGKVQPHPPVVGVNVLRHPRKPELALLLLSFGIGCVILKLYFQEDLPDPIRNFFQDERISFAGFGIPEKKDLFPFDKLGLKDSKIDVGFLAAKLLNDPKLKKSELVDLARRVLGIKTMVGLAETRSFSRNKQIKSAICEVFLSSVIAMALLDPTNNIKVLNCAKKSLFAKNLDQHSLTVEGWTKMLTRNKENNDHQARLCDDDFHVKAKGEEDAPGDDSGKAVIKPPKGILKCASSGSNARACYPLEAAGQSGQHLRRANSKGYNVSFKEK